MVCTAILDVTYIAPKPVPVLARSALVRVYTEIQQMVSTNTEHWDVIPDIIADGVSDQEDVMTAICETKGATFDGTDCVGELDDSTVFVSA